MTEFELRESRIPDRLRYLAAELRKGHATPEAVAALIDAVADEMEQGQPAYMQALAEFADSDLRDALDRLHELRVRLRAFLEEAGR